MCTFDDLPLHSFNVEVFTVFIRTCASLRLPFRCLNQPRGISMLQEQQCNSTTTYSISYLQPVCLCSRRSTRRTRKTSSKGSSWPDSLHTSSSTSSDSPRITFSLKRIPPSSISPSRESLPLWCLYNKSSSLTPWRLGRFYLWVNIILWLCIIWFLSSVS